MTLVLGFLKVPKKNQHVCELTKVRAVNLFCTCDLPQIPVSYIYRLKSARLAIESVILAT